MYTKKYDVYCSACKFSSTVTIESDKSFKFESISDDNEKQYTAGTGVCPVCGKKLAEIYNDGLLDSIINLNNADGFDVTYFTPGRFMNKANLANTNKKDPRATFAYNTPILSFTCRNNKIADRLLEAFDYDLITGPVNMNYQLIAEICMANQIKCGYDSPLLVYNSSRQSDSTYLYSYCLRGIGSHPAVDIGLFIHRQNQFINMISLLDEIVSEQYSIKDDVLKEIMCDD